MRSSSDEPALVWPDKDPAAKRKFGCDFTLGLIRYWKRGTQVASTDTVRPTITRSNGYEYECTTGGWTGAKEPVWPTTLGATVMDGSAVWTCQALSTASLYTTISGTPTWTAVGATVSGEDLAGQLTTAFIEGGDDGEDISVVIAAPMADDSVYVQVCILPIRRAVRPS